MARAIWSGAVSFGLVNVPVKLYSAVSEKTVRFNQMNSKTGARVRQQRIDPTTDEEVPMEDIVKGYEIASDRYVIIEPSELEAIAPTSSKIIELGEFVPIADIDPIFYDKSYYLGPDAGSSRTYRLLVKAMEQAGMVGIGKVVLRSKEKLVALRPLGGRLVCTTLYFGDEVLDPQRVIEEDEQDQQAPGDREVAMATQLVESLIAEWEPANYRDQYRDQVLDLIERKAAGEAIEAPQAIEAAPQAPNLLAALEASLAAVKDDKAAEDPKPKRTRKSKPKDKATA